MQIQLKKKYLYSAILIIFFIGWFSWLFIESSQTHKMEARVKGLLGTALQKAATDTPRVKVMNNGKEFYGPDLNNSHFMSSVYSRLNLVMFEGLQSQTSPFSKMESLKMDTDYISQLHAEATVKFVVFAGLTKTITVSETIQAPRYKEITGLAEMDR
ncbi:hypothetical protein SD71_03235 [Cohnella kolymensis]|uniref:Uncharacterized protein n=1 Tax=Cohnella kolymensis TaxID=1590652 RepID=A0ABR5A9Q8_9BACL|nr:hypothetical protein [Cohnella kolymensis]KIL37627.1 hypothetical protein SD71_03235 [Cohnella kolymensis]